jgi:phosphate-selective porin OprO and OprP
MDVTEWRRMPDHSQCAWLRVAATPLLAALAALTSAASAQDRPAAAPASAKIPPAAPANEVLDRLRLMEERLDRVTKQNEEMKGRLDRVTEQNQRLARENQELVNSRRDGVSRTTDPAVETQQFESTRSDSSGESRSSSGGGSASGGGDPTTTGRAQEVGNRRLGKIPLKSAYNFGDDGVTLSTLDDEFTFGVRAMTQIDSRIYQQKNQFPVSSGVYNPRTRVYFEGRLTKPIQYEFSFQNTFDSLNLLDAYLNFNYDSRLQLRIGRYKTPFTYEWYRIHVWHLLAPERSLFANNYEGNRRFGLMGWGDLFDQRLEYAVGTFNTQRNSYQAFSDRQDVMAFLNFKPFYQQEDGSLLRDFHIGGSVDAGHENQPVVPAALRTNSAPSAQGVGSSAAANSATLPFMAFKSGVVERGDRALWELHAAEYFGGLSLLAAWQGGRETYANGATGPTTPIPIGGWFAQVGYIVTGETIRDRTLIDPLHPFDLRSGRFGLGALELTARYSELDLDRRVFTAGLVDPNLWTNRAEMTDVGFNWYLNKFVKISFDWEHAMFGNPVVFNTQTGRKQLTSDLFWMRFQFYF